MMKKTGLTGLCVSLLCLCGCQKELVSYKQGDVKVTIEQGDEWLHDFPLFMGIKLKNPPQVAVWTEDLQGNYLSTIYVTNRIANQSWRAAGDERRKEALPHWCYSRGVQYEDGLFLPTKAHPLTDGTSGATPKGTFEVKILPLRELQQFVIKVEVNHSIDFNEAYPKTAKLGEPNYSGGEMGSGQPALVYAATVDLSLSVKSFEAVLVGCSSPDGTNGGISPDLLGITTARSIVKRIMIEKR